MSELKISAQIWRETAERQAIIASINLSTLIILIALRKLYAVYLRAFSAAANSMPFV